MPVTRRELLGQAGKFGLAAGAASSVGWLAGCGDGGGVSQSAWDDLDRQISGVLLRPGEAGYRKASRPAITVYDNVRPVAVALCVNAEDVRRSVLWAQEHNVEVGIRGR